MSQRRSSLPWARAAPASGAYTISRIIAAIPTKMIARSTTMSAAIHGWCSPTAALMMVNSLMNMPNGGDPVTANNPITSRIPDAGTRRSSPRISSAADVPVTSTTLPTAKTASPWPGRC